MIPLYFLKPCLLALEELVNDYHATVVFCTATKPDFPEGILTTKPTEIMENPQSLYTALQRTNYQYIGSKTDEEVISFLETQESYARCVYVAPFTGAWIEILIVIIKPQNQLVAPFTGAWIEISHQSKSSWVIKSHPSRVRGLKYCTYYINIILFIVAPFTGAWIEIMP